MREHLLDQPDLTGGIDLVLDAIGDEVVVGRVRCLMRARAVLHRLKEFVGERLHHQSDFGLGARIGCCGQAQGNDDQHRPETPQNRHETLLQPIMSIVGRERG